MEVQIRADIDAKKLQVRQLVGDSYHDLITSADYIQQMSNATAAVSADLEHIRGTFTELERSLSHTDADAAAQARRMTSSQLELYGAAPLDASVPARGEHGAPSILYPSTSNVWQTPPKQCPGISPCTAPENDQIVGDSG